MAVFIAISQDWCELFLVWIYRQIIIIITRDCWEKKSLGNCVVLKISSPLVITNWIIRSIKKCDFFYSFERKTLPTLLEIDFCTQISLRVRRCTAASALPKMQLRVILTCRGKYYQIFKIADCEHDVKFSKLTFVILNFENLMADSQSATPKSQKCRVLEKFWPFEISEILMSFSESAISKTAV